MEIHDGNSFRIGPSSKKSNGNEVAKVLSCMIITGLEGDVDHDLGGLSIITACKCIAT